VTQKARHQHVLATAAATGLLSSIALPAWADDCDRPAIFWMVGDGDFADASNFFKSCAPLPTDNVTFGASPYPTSGTVTFSSAAEVNSLLFGNGSWTAVIDSPVTATSGIVAAGTLTLEGSENSEIATGEQGTVSANQLTLESGLSLGADSVSIRTLSLLSQESGVAKLQLLAGGTIEHLYAPEGGEIDALGGATGGAPASLTLGSGFLSEGTIRVPAGNLFLNAVKSGDLPLTIGYGSQITASTIYFGVGLGNSILINAGEGSEEGGPDDSVQAETSYIYDQVTFQNGDGTTNHIDLGNTTIGGGGGGLLDITGKAGVVSDDALISGNGADDVLAAHIAGGGQWHIQGNLTVTGANVLIEEASNLGVGGALNMVPVLSPIGASTAATITVTDPGSVFFVVGDATVGGAGTATVNVQGGASAVFEGETNLGLLAGSQGTITASGIDDVTPSTVKFQDNLTVGAGGSGTFNVQEGATAEVEGETTIALLAGSRGIVNVGNSAGSEDADLSQLNFQQAVTVGAAGNGTLNVLTYGNVAGGSFVLGAQAGSSGTVSVGGLNARLLASALVIGQAGAGTVDVGAGGKINTLSIAMATATGGSGSLTIDQGGTVVVSNQVTLGNGGVINVTSGGALTVGSGISAAPGSARIDTGGALRGGGTVDGNLVISGGTVSLGDPVTLTVNGNLTETSGVLDLEADGTGAGQFDRLIVNGSIALSGGVVDVDFGGGFVPQAGETFALMTAGDGMAFSNDLFQYLNAPAGFQFKPVFNSATDTFDLVVIGTKGGGGGTGVPEPPSRALMLCALAALAWHGSRRRTGRGYRPAG
jgi:T5SS/PEP-CTERM-associated repeat protein